MKNMTYTWKKAYENKTQSHTKICVTKKSIPTLKGFSVIGDYSYFPSGDMVQGSHSPYVADRSNHPDPMRPRGCILRRGLHVRRKWWGMSAGQSNHGNDESGNGSKPRETFKSSSHDNQWSGFGQGTVKGWSIYDVTIVLIFFDLNILLLPIMTIIYFMLFKSLKW